MSLKQASPTPSASSTFDMDSTNSSMDVAKQNRLERLLSDRGLQNAPDRPETGMQDSNPERKKSNQNNDMTFFLIEKYITCIDRTIG